MIAPDLLSTFSDTAMVLAAGFGMRLRPLTLAKPKPLHEIAGKPMLDYALDHLERAGLRRAVVNAHYLGDQIAAHLVARAALPCHSCLRGDNAEGRMALALSPEREILDTGGGVKNARAFFGDKPFFLLNADLPLLNGSVPVLERMASFWDAGKMEALLLLYPTAKARGFGPGGDFMMDETGRVFRQGTQPPRPYVWLSAMIVKPQLYDEVPEAVFSNNKIFDLAESRGRLFGILHDGACYQISAPEDLTEANRRLATGEGWL